MLPPAAGLSFSLYRFPGSSVTEAVGLKSACQRPPCPATSAPSPLGRIEENQLTFVGFGSHFSQLHPVADGVPSSKLPAVAATSLFPGKHPRAKTSERSG